MKKRRGIKRILLGAILALCLGTTACGQSAQTGQNAAGGNSDGGQTSGDTVSEVTEYQSIGRWGNIPAEVSYEIPYIPEGRSKGGGNFVSLHGHSFCIYEKYTINVETLREKEADLETLPLQIAQEKQSDDYSLFYDKKYYVNQIYSSVEDIAKTEQVKVGDYDAVCFESSEFYAFADGSKYIGYSFFCGDKPVCVYGVYTPVHLKFLNLTEDGFKNLLKSIVESVEPYNGEAFVELDPACDWNYKNYLERYSHGQNGKICWCTDYWGTYSGNVDVICPEEGDEDTAFFAELNPGPEEIFDVVCQNMEYQPIPSRYGPYDVWYKNNVTINGIDMIRYSGMARMEIGGEINNGSYFVVYTFEIDGEPYFFQCYMSADWSDTSIEGKYENEENLLYYSNKWADIIADTYIRTIMTTEQVENGKKLAALP